jgi:cytochrome P450
MHYQQACITEAMRLTPVIGISLFRTVPAEGAIIEGHQLSAGDVVGMNPWIVHRDKELFGEDAEEFRPERYLDASENQKHAMQAMSLSFGGPSRSCPGQNLAWLAPSKTVSAIFLHFEIEILDEKEATKYGHGFREDCFFVVKWYDVWMRMKPRN